MTIGDMANASELAQLSSKLGFTLRELELNRAGQISSEQSWLALRTAVASLGMMLVALGGILVIVGLKSSGLLRLVLYVVLIPGCGGVFYFFCVDAVGAIQRRVLTAEGTVSFRGGSRGPPSLIIGRASVASPPNARDVLTAPTGYRLYYLGRTNQFLSIEPL